MAPVSSDDASDAAKAVANDYNGGDVQETGLTEEEKQQEQAEAVEEANIDEIEESDEFVARIGTVGYASLKDAVAAAQANDTIEMTANDPSTENVTVNKVVTIKMNEKTFGGTIVVATTGTNAVTVVGEANVDAVIRLGNRYFNSFVTANNSTVYLMKSITMEQLYMTAYDSTARNWTIDLGGHTINFANYDSDGGVYIGSYYGTNHNLTMRNGSVVFNVTSSTVGFHAYGNLTLENLDITAKGGAAIKTEAGYWDGPGAITMTNCTVNAEKLGIELISYKSGSTVRQSVATLSGVTINAKDEAIKSNGARVTVENCSISSQNKYGISTFNSTSGSLPSEVTISGTTTIVANNDHAINCTSGTFTISGNADVTGTIYVQSSSLTIAGGVYHGNFSLGGSGQLTIAGGTFDGNLINVTQAGRLLVIGETQFDELTTYTITGSNGNYEVTPVAA